MTAPRDSGYLIPSERLDNAILEIRGRKVMLSHDLAALYGVSTKAFNQAVKRNADRFPPDFMFQLTQEEAQALRSQSVTSNVAGSRSQIVTLKRGSNIKYLPSPFSEHGAVTAATILNTPREGTDQPRMNTDEPAPAGDCAVRDQRWHDAVSRRARAMSDGGRCASQCGPGFSGGRTQPADHKCEASLFACQETEASTLESRQAGPSLASRELSCKVRREVRREVPAKVS